MYGVMKVVLFCNHQVSLFAVQDLIRRGCLAGVVTSNLNHIFMTEAAVIAQSQGIPYYQCGNDQLKNGLVDWLSEVAPDVVVVVTFPWRLPKEVLDLPPLGCWNFHMGLLPEYRGPDPSFWQIKNGDSHGGLTVHKMVERFDEGPVLLRKMMPIVQGDVLGTHLNRVAQQAPEGIQVLWDYLQHGKGELMTQGSDVGHYYFRPTLEDLTIDWNLMDSGQIVSLICAANPHYQGAVTEFRSTNVYLYEAEAVHLDDPPNEEPGTIVDAPGNPNFYILCRDSACLWVKVVSVPDGVFSGERIREMFKINSGERFQSPSDC